MTITENNSQTNNFSKGLITDVDPLLMPSNQYNAAVNIRVKNNILSAMPAMIKFGYTAGRTPWDNLLWLIQDGYEIVGHNTIDNFGILFLRKNNEETGEKGTYSLVLRITFSEPEISRGRYTEQVLKPIFNTILRGNYDFGDYVESVFDKTEEDVVRRDTDSDSSIQKGKKINMYFVDGKNPMRCITINGDAYDENATVDILKEFKIYPLQHISTEAGGSLPVGKVQYAYLLFSNRGTESPSSPLTPLISVYPDQTLKPTAEDISSEKKVKLYLQIDPNGNFDWVRLFSIHYTEKNLAPKIHIMTVNIVGQSSIIIEDGNTNYTEGDYDIQNLPSSVSNDLISSTVTKIADRLFIASVNTATTSFDVDVDTRAYRGCYSAVKRIPLRIRQGEDIQYLSIDDILAGTDGKITSTSDVINPYNQHFGPLDEENDGAYLPEEDAGKNRWFGGKGKVVSYRLITTILPLDNRSLNETAGRYYVRALETDHLYSYRWMRKHVNEDRPLYYVGSASNGKPRLAKVENNGFVNISGELSYKNPLVVNSLTGYTRDEVYRFGIIFYNSKMTATPVYWIGDIKMPSDRLCPAFGSGADQAYAGSLPSEMDHTQLTAYPLGILFIIDTNQLPADVVGYEIVRCDRKVLDRRVLMQGVISYTCTSELYDNHQMPTPYLTMLATGLSRSGEIISDAGINRIYWGRHDAVWFPPNRYNRNDVDRLISQGTLPSDESGYLCEWRRYSNTKNLTYYGCVLRNDKGEWKGIDGIYARIDDLADVDSYNDVISRNNIIFISAEACTDRSVVENIKDINGVSLTSDIKIQGISKLSSPFSSYTSLTYNFKWMDVDGYREDWYQDLDAYGYCMDNAAYNDILKWTGENEGMFPNSESDTRWGRFCKLQEYPISPESYNYLGTAGALLPWDELRSLVIPWQNRDGRCPHISKYYIQKYKIVTADGTEKYADEILIGDITEIVSSYKRAEEVPSYGLIVWLNTDTGLGNETDTDNVINRKVVANTIKYINVSETLFKNPYKCNNGRIQYGRDLAYRIVGTHGPCLIINKNNILSEFGYGIQGDINTVLKVNLVREIEPYGGYSYSARQLSSYSSTGKFVSVAPNTGTSHSNVYQGDTFLHLLDYPVTMQSNLYPRAENGSWNGSNRQAYIGAFIPVETTTDLERMYSHNTFNDTSTNTAIATDAMLAVPYILETATDTVKEWSNFRLDYHCFLYNNAYSITDSAKIYATKSMYDDKETSNKYSVKISYSDKKSLQGVNDGFTKFTFDNATIIDASYGNINKMFTFKDKLYILLDKALSHLQVEPQALLSTSQDPDVKQNELLLGSSDKVGRLTYIVLNYGLRLPDIKTFCMTDRAVYWYDRDNKELLSFTGDQIIPLNTSLKCKNLLQDSVVDFTYYDRIDDTIMFCRTYNNPGIARGIAYDQENGYFTCNHNRMFSAVLDINKDLQAGVAPNGEMFLVNGDYKYPSTGYKDTDSGVGCRYIDSVTKWYGDLTNSTGDRLNKSYVTFTINKYPDITKVFDYFVFPTNYSPNLIDNLASGNTHKVRYKNSLADDVRNREGMVYIPCGRETENDDSINPRIKRQYIQARCYLDLDSINKLSYIKTIFRQSKF